MESAQTHRIEHHQFDRIEYQYDYFGIHGSHRIYVNVDIKHCHLSNDASHWNGGRYPIQKNKTMVKPPMGSLLEKRLMLAIAYSASIGGFASLIGTPPNLVLAGVLEETYGVKISFMQWMKIGLPISAHSNGNLLDLPYTVCFQI